MLTFVSLFAILKVLWHLLNYSIEVSVKRSPYCHVRYCFINSFSLGPTNFANNVFVHRFQRFQMFFI